MNLITHIDPVVVDTDKAEIQRIFELQKTKQFDIGSTTVKQRKAKLNKLHQLILKYRPRIKEALNKDFKKHPMEVDLTEIYPITAELKHTKKHLSRWMNKHRVSTPLAMMGSSSHIKYEPKGVVLIVSPWNFPFNLTFVPLVSAIAAGNCVMIKTSEMTPNSTALMKQMIEECFNEDEVAFIEGGIPASTHLLEMPFNHIFFTGSPMVGKIVMKAAAQNLTSVTLELGGKSPTIIDKTANLKQTAQRLTIGKFTNNGQICIAPDYVFVHEDVKDKFVALLKDTIQSFYSKNIQNEPSYCRIVNNRHFNRLKDAIEDTVTKGATVELGGVTDDNDNFIPPTILSNPAMDSKIMTDEIFGPVLPILSYTDINQVIRDINGREKPLALYIYSKNRKNTDHIINNTRAGGTCINHNGVHYYNMDLPFGGSNNSGIGKGHGFEGFKAFSNGRAIFNQHITNALDFLVPPYTGLKEKIGDLTIKYF